MEMDERTLRMIDWSVALVRAGEEYPPIAEVAQRFKISDRTVRHHLDDIVQKANVAGITRESLLTRPHKKHSQRHDARKKLKQPLELEVFHMRCASVMDDMNDMKVSIQKNILELDVLLQEDI